jgi:hypothetical protein
MGRAPFQSRFVRHLLPTLLVAAALALLPPPLVAEEHAPALDKVKAAFIINILRFVTWPAPNPSDQLTICVFRTLPAAMTNALNGYTIGGRTTVVYDIHSLTNNIPCAALVIPDTELAAYAAQYRQQTEARATLTLADITNRTANGKNPEGVMVALVRNNTRIGLQVNLGAVRQAGLKMSSELLKLATLVDG